MPKTPTILPAPRGRTPAINGPAAMRNMRKMLGPRPVIFGENSRDFDLLHRSLMEELQPQGLIENILVKEIATANWCIQRADRFLERLVHLTLPEAARREIGQRLAKIDQHRGGHAGNGVERLTSGVELKAIYMTIGLEEDYDSFVEMMCTAGVNHDDLALTATLLQQKAFKDARRSASAECGDTAKASRLIWSGGNARWGGVLARPGHCAGERMT